MRRGGTAGASSSAARAVARTESTSPEDRCRHLAAHMGSPRGLNGLERLNLLGLRALGPPAGRVLNPLVLLKAAVTVSLDGGVMNEDVIGAVIRGDETVPLVGVEPLHSALSHCARYSFVGA